MLYNVVLAFAIHRHEPATGMHVSPPTPPPSPPSRWSQSAGLEPPAAHGEFPPPVSHAVMDVFPSYSVRPTL